MNRIEFIGQTYSGEDKLPLDHIINFFDHIMAAYTVIGNVNGIEMYGTTDISQSLLKFIIKSTDSSILQGIASYINNNLHNNIRIYERSFTINASIDGDTINLFVRKSLI